MPATMTLIVMYAFFAEAAPAVCVSATYFCFDLFRFPLCIYDVLFCLQVYMLPCRLNGARRNCLAVSAHSVQCMQIIGGKSPEKCSYKFCSIQKRHILV